jgi:hypothetical protein
MSPFFSQLSKAPYIFVLFRSRMPSSCQEVFNDLAIPTEQEVRSLEDLVDALRPVEMLTKRLCQANFDVLKVL